MDYDAQIKNLTAQFQALDAELQQKTVIKFKLMGAIEVLAALKQAEAAERVEAAPVPPTLEVVK